MDMDMEVDGIGGNDVEMLASSFTISENDPRRQNRHCAYCLLQIQPKDVKLCGNCHRRSYCSRKCQAKDWSPKILPFTEQQGQGHKNWCELNIGEEGLDWKVAPVLGKGLGIVALRPIQKMERIMVEGFQMSPEAHPAIKDLEPQDGALKDKFKFNRPFCVENWRSVKGVTIRMSRLNHNCRRNATRTLVCRFNVQVLYAERDIELGEEICVNYIPFRMPENGICGGANLARLLKTKWNFECEEDCVCRNENFQKISTWCIEQEVTGRAIAEIGIFDQSICIGKEIMARYDVVEASILEKVRVIQGLIVDIAVQRRETLKEARQYVKILLELLEPVKHPKDSQIMAYQEWLQALSSHPNFLLAEYF